MRSFFLASAALCLSGAFLGCDAPTETPKPGTPAVTPAPEAPKDKMEPAPKDKMEPAPAPTETKPAETKPAEPKATELPK